MARLSSVDPSCVSLFSGCGGLDLGFIQAGYRRLAAYDIDQASVATYNLNLAPTTAEVLDLSKDSRRTAELKPDVVIAGPPCQGFSTIGSHHPSDPRNNLLLKPVDFALSSKAQVLVIENVRGLLSRDHLPFWQRAVSRLQRGGYATTTFEISAGMVGLAQLRRRVVLVARRGRSKIEPMPERPLEPKSLSSVLCVRTALPNHLPRPLVPGSRVSRIAERIRPGQKLSNVRRGPRAVHTWHIPEVFGHVSTRERRLLDTLVVLRRRNRVRSFGDADPVAETDLVQTLGSGATQTLKSLVNKEYIRHVEHGLYDLRHTFNGKFRRLDPDRPAHCVLTRFCDPYYFLHPSEQRGFTIREAARLQGFPDSFEFTGSAREQASQVGNAVPPPLARLLAKWIKTDVL